MYATLPVNTHSFATKCSTFAPRRTLSRTEGEGDIAATLSGRFPCVPDYLIDTAGAIKHYIGGAS